MSAVIGANKPGKPVVNKADGNMVLSFSFIVVAVLSSSYLKASHWFFVADKSAPLFSWNSS